MRGLTFKEHYAKTEPSALSGLHSKEKDLKHLELLSKAADSISDGDLVDRMVHGCVHLTVNIVLTEKWRATLVSSTPARRHVDGSTSIADLRYEQQGSRSRLGRAIVPILARTKFEANQVEPDAGRHSDPNETQGLWRQG